MDTVYRKTPVYLLSGLFVCVSVSNHICIQISVKAGGLEGGNEARTATKHMLKLLSWRPRQVAPLTLPYCRAALLLSTPHTILHRHHNL